MKGSTGLGGKERKQLSKCEQRRSERGGRSKQVDLADKRRTTETIEGILLVGRRRR